MTLHDPWLLFVAAPIAAYLCWAIPTYVRLVLHPTEAQLHPTTPKEEAPK